MQAAQQRMCGRLRFQTLALIASVLLAGCAAHVSGLSRDPGFDYHSAVARGFVIGGVVSSLREDIDGDAETLLAKAFAEEAPAYSLENRRQFSEAVGEDVHQQLMAELRQNNELSADSISQISAGTSISQYVVFVHLARGQIFQTRHSFDRAGYVVNQRYHVTRTTTSRQTSRAVTATAIVVDPVDAVVVWRGTVSPRVSNTNNRTTHYLFSWSDYEWYYPAPPSLNRAVEAAFAGFVENLPRAD